MLGRFRFATAALLLAVVAHAKPASAQEQPSSASDSDAGPAPAQTSPPAVTPDTTPVTPTAPAAERSVEVDPPPPRAMRFTGMLGVISLPRLLSLEALVRFRKKDDPRWDLFSVGAGIDYLPPGIANFGEDTTLSWLQFGADARFFVWRFLFAGARFGWQFSRADSEKFGSEVDYVTTAFVFAPKIGALYTLQNSGFTFGGDLGATIPIGADTTLYSDSTQDSNARKAAKTFGMFVMPQVAARVGWTF